MSVVFLLLGFFIGAFVMKDGNQHYVDYVQRSRDAALVCSDPSRTTQADLIDSDINVIVARFNVTSMVPAGVRVPEYQDYDGVFDFQTAQQALIDAERNFMAMPAQLRAQFDNDPGNFLTFCSDPGNMDALRDMGLAIPKVVEASIANTGDDVK